MHCHSIFADAHMATIKHYPFRRRFPSKNGTLDGTHDDGSRRHGPLGSMRCSHSPRKTCARRPFRRLTFHSPIAAADLFPRRLKGYHRHQYHTSIYPSDSDSRPASISGYIRTDGRTNADQRQKQERNYPTRRRRRRRPRSGTSGTSPAAANTYKAGRASLGSGIAAVAAAEGEGVKMDAVGLRLLPRVPHSVTRSPPPLPSGCKDGGGGGGGDGQCESVA